MVCVQSKLKALVANMTPPHAKAVKAADMKTGTVYVKQIGIL